MSTEAETDGHWPFAANHLIGCECGWAPKRPPARMSMQHVPHMAHRRRLGLRPVEYRWPDVRYMKGLSTGGYMRVSNAEWRDGKWVPTEE